MLVLLGPQHRKRYAILQLVGRTWVGDAKISTIWAFAIRVGCGCFDVFDHGSLTISICPFRAWLAIVQHGNPQPQPSTSQQCQSQTPILSYPGPKPLHGAACPALAAGQPRKRWNAGALATLAAYSSGSLLFLYAKLTANTSCRPPLA